MGRKSGLFVLSLVLCFCAFDGNCGTQPPPSARLLDARTVSLENFATGCAQCSNHAYRELAQWKRLKVVAEEREADLIFQFSGKTEATRMPTDGAGSTEYWIYLTVLDAKTGEGLWNSALEMRFQGQPGKELVQRFRKMIDHADQNH